MKHMFSEDDSDTLCYWSVFVKVRWSEETDRFVGPVVLHEDILSSVLSSISKQHDDLVAVCSAHISLVKGTNQTSGSSYVKLFFFFRPGDGKQYSAVNTHDPRIMNPNILRDLQNFPFLFPSQMNSTPEENKLLIWMSQLPLVISSCVQSASKYC